MTLQRCIATLVAAVSSAIISIDTAAAASAVRPEDLFKMALVSNAQISHDGKLVAFVVTKLNGPKNEYRSNIWLVDVAGGGVRQLTRGDSDSNPQWSPDDRWIAFESGRKEKSQIYRIALAGGEAERITDRPDGASSPVWSYDGSRVAFLASTKDSKRKSPIDWHATGFEPDDSQRTSDVRIFDVLHFEVNGAGETWMYHPHIWVMRADGSDQKQLTSGTQWSEREIAWAPNDQSIYFTSYRAADPYLFRSDLYTIPASGGEMHKLPLAHPSNSQSTFAPGGTQVWYFVASQPDPAGLTGVASANLDGSGERVLVPENTVAFGDALLTDTKEGGNGCGPVFGPGQRWFIADVSVPGGTAIQRFDAQTGAAQTLVARGDEVEDCSMSDDGSRIAFTASDATHLGEIFVADGRTGESRQLSFLNKTYLDLVDLSTPEPFTVVDHAGLTVHAWFMRPPHAVAGRRYPTLLEIHGGPETEFGNSFFHEMQYFAGLGYNVVFSDPRGSVGFGYEFTRELEHNWGDPMFDDVTAVMDSVVKRSDVDSARLGVLGGSYGGYATLWVVGHTKRFAAAIAERVVSNMNSELLASDYASANSDAFSFGNPWDHDQTLWQMSPLKYVRNVATPLLLIHSDNDIRTPIDQALQEYAALKILGKTTTLVQFPRDNHDLSRTGEPIHRVERLHIMADWFKKYLKP